MRDYIHVEDLAAAHLLALEAIEPGRHKIYNLGNGKGFSNLQIVEMVRAVTGEEVKVSPAPRRAGDPATLIASSVRARAELGWVAAKPDLASIVGDAWTFFQTRRTAGYNPLTGEWVLVSPHRTHGPGRARSRRRAPEQRPGLRPDVLPVPRQRARRRRHDPDYDGTFVFDNDFAALLPDTGRAARVDDGLLRRAESERGICRVVCFSPRHDLTLGGMTQPAHARGWSTPGPSSTAELGALDWVGYVQIFENRGAMMGASNPHPHGQIWATEQPAQRAGEGAAPAAGLRRTRAAACCATIWRWSCATARGWSAATSTSSALVPFWAVWPFETLVLPRAHHGALTDLDGAERDGLADILSRLTTRYDNLFEVSFPYSMGFHQRPTDGGDHPEWHLHAHFYPPLLRSATVRKFMVGYRAAGRAAARHHARERRRAAAGSRQRLIFAAGGYVPPGNGEGRAWG